MRVCTARNALIFLRKRVNRRVRSEALAPCRAGDKPTGRAYIRHARLAVMTDETANLILERMRKFARARGYA